MPRLRIASPQDFAGALFLMAIGAFALWASSDLSMGTLRSMGPGMLPRSLAWIVIGLGGLLMLASMRFVGPRLERWSLRGVIFILGGALAFSATIRGLDLPGPINIPALGLVGAGPLVAIVAAFASPETRWHEVAIFAAVMTAICVLVFRFALGLPIPLAPFLLGY
jgi:putative tricarboxylic transport membrane protein